MQPLPTDRSRFTIFQDLLISVSPAGPLLDEEWQRFLKVLQTAPITRYVTGSLGKVETSSLQRKQSAETLKARGIRTAVLTDDTLVRGVVTAVSWLGANVNAFAWNDLKSAFSYLGYTGPTADRAIGELLRVRREVEVRNP